MEGTFSLAELLGAVVLAEGIRRTQNAGSSGSGKK